MPPKPKLHKNTGKNTAALQAAPSTSTVIISPELEQQFEVELTWCIQQLQTAINSGKLNQKQTQDHVKTLNTLMSHTAPMVKKRQVMRLSFGDYRAKMAAEDKKHSRGTTNFKITSASPNQKSLFIRRSPFCTSDNSFRFNHKLDENHLSEEVSNMELNKNNEETSQEERKFKFNCSDNSFKFNFSTNDNE